jgi:hypothetical protein
VATRTPRKAHPDDALRRLARTGRPSLGPVVDRGAPKPPSNVRQFNVAIIVGLVFLTGLVFAPFAVPGDKFTITGLEAKAALRARDVRKMIVRIIPSSRSSVPGLEVRLDGETMPITRRASFATWRPPADLADGSHRLTVRSGDSFLWRGPTTKTLRFTVDRVRPALTVSSKRNVNGKELVLDGSAEVGVDLRVNGVSVPVGKDGKFTSEFRRAPIGTVEIVATDLAKNQTRRLIRTNGQKQKIRGVYVTANGWKISSVRNPVFRMAANRQINSVMLTLKDEDGVLSYRSKVARAAQLGANTDLLDLTQTVNELHAKGLRVVGRVVVFRDPLYVADALRTNHLDRVVMGTNGQPFFGSDGVFANPANPDAQRYNLDIIAEAGASGIDDLIIDDVRRPAGLASSMTLAGLPPTLEGLDESLASFTRNAGGELRGLNIGFGVTVMGISLIDPLAYGQDVKRLAPIVDYVAPKIFPSRFPAGSFGITDPPAQPLQTAASAIKAAFRQVASTDAAILPLFQDFSEGRANGPGDVRAQIDASDQLGIKRFILVDPKMSYNTGGIPRTATSVLGSTSVSGVTPETTVVSTTTSSIPLSP